MFMVGNLPADVRVDPSGRSVYIVNHDSHEVVQYNVNLQNGALSFDSTLLVRGSPSDIAFAQGNQALQWVPRFVHATNELDGTVSGYTIDPGNGALTAIV